MYLFKIILKNIGKSKKKAQKLIDDLNSTLRRIIEKINEYYYY